MQGQGEIYQKSDRPAEKSVITSRSKKFGPVFLLCGKNQGTEPAASYSCQPRVLKQIVNS